MCAGPQASGAFSYTDDEWVKVVSGNAKPDADLHQLRIALETAGRRYQANRRDPRLQTRLRQALAQARAHVALARDARFPPARLAALRAAVVAIKAEIGGGRTALIEDAVRGWSRTTGDPALTYSRTHGADRAPDPLSCRSPGPDPGRGHGRPRDADQSDP